VLLHGVPASSFLYRKVIPVVAQQGLQAVAFDFPGLGLADRPVEFDYSWSGLARWTGEAIDALGIDRCHLVVHDIGGPIGFEWAIRNPERVHSLTALDMMLELDGFRRPWSMRPFAIPGIGRIALRTLSRFAFSEAFYAQGIADRRAVPRHEVYVHYEGMRHATPLFWTLQAVTVRTLAEATGIAGAEVGILVGRDSPSHCVIGARWR